MIKMPWKRTCGKDCKYLGCDKTAIFALYMCNDAKPIMTYCKDHAIDVAKRINNANLLEKRKEMLDRLEGVELREKEFAIRTSQKIYVDAIKKLLSSSDAMGKNVLNMTFDHITPEYIAENIRKGYEK